MQTNITFDAHFNPPTLHHNVTWEECEERAARIGNEIHRVWPDAVRIWGVPRGGVYAAMLVKDHLTRMGVSVRLVNSKFDADVAIDDIVDSGATYAKIVEECGEGKPFYCLYNKLSPIQKFQQEIEAKNVWLVMPWETDEKNGPQENIRRIIEYIGDDPNRPGLLETPDRVIRSYRELFGGYKQDVKSVFKTFEGVSYDEMVILKGIEFYSTCEHHMIPFVGTAHIAYIPMPKGPVVGASKLARVLEIYSRRLQIQEQLTKQVTDAIDEHLKPLGAACVLEARHFCICSRGVQKQGSSMVTSSLTGAFRKLEVREEFLRLIGK